MPVMSPCVLTFEVAFKLEELDEDALELAEDELAELELEELEQPAKPRAQTASEHAAIVAIIFFALADVAFNLSHPFL